MKSTNPLIKILLATGLLVILMLVFYFVFFADTNQKHQQLEGIWVRTDGEYKIEIKEAKPEGKLLAAYFNPNPINVGRAGWRMENEELQIFVELRDENYPGSIYQLAFDEETEMLQGTYYQAVVKQTYEVNFKKINE